MAMEISLNGEKRSFEAPLTVASLLKSLEIRQGSVVVERNLRIVARSEMEHEPVEEGDSIEIIRLVAGG
jgi:thiamine biosynthesis protein ThiS